MKSNQFRPAEVAQPYAAAMASGLWDEGMEDELRAAFGRRLRDARLSARNGEGYTQQDVADRFGVVKATVSAWEKGRGTPDPLMLRRLARLYETRVEILMNERPLSTGAVQIAEQFDRMTDKQRTTVRALWQAYVSGEELPPPPAESRAEEDEIARQVIARSTPDAAKPVKKRRLRK